MLRAQLALVRLERALWRKYRPDQPRVPAGNGRQSGRWRSEDNSAGESSTRDVGRTRIAQNDTLRRYSVNLSEEEARGGHTITRHIAKSDDEMLAGARKGQFLAPGLTLHTFRHGSFRSLGDANDLTSRTLEHNRDAVDEVAAGNREKDFV